jgi:hypothetical protein
VHTTPHTIHTIQDMTAVVSSTAATATPEKNPKKKSLNDEQKKRYINKHLNLLCTTERKKICKNLYQYFHVDFKSSQNGLYVEFDALNNESLEYMYNMITFYIDNTN